MTDNLAAPIPEKCCFCFYQPGGHLMAKSHYVLSIGAIIFGVMVGVGDEQRSFSEFDPIVSSFNESLSIPVAKKETIRAFYVTAISLCLVLIFVRFLLVFMARFVSQETVARLSGILPSQTTRSQVAKFKLDHHKMIYKEKRRMSMPAQPRLSDIPEGSESQLSSRNVSKLSTSAGGHSNMTLHST